MTRREPCERWTSLRSAGARARGRATSLLMGGALVLWLGLALLAPAESWATSLSDLAASMSPGTWKELTTSNINPVLTNTGGESNVMTGYTEYIKWDPATRRLLFVGADHNQVGGERFVSYTDSTNSWQILPQPPGMGAFSHGYDHGALDPVNRFFYFRYPYLGRTFYRYQMDTGVWTQVATNNIIEYEQCCGGLDYFPEMNGVIWAQGGETPCCGGVFLLDNATGQWRRIGSINTYALPGYSTFAEYNPVHKVVVFGGGQGAGARKLFKVTAAGQVVALGDAPANLGTLASVFTVDPVSGDYLVLTNSKQFYRYDVVADTWTLLPDPPAGVWGTQNPFVFGMVAGPISTYGVVAVGVCRDSSGSNCHLYIYKHSTGTPSPPPTAPVGLQLR